MNQCIKVAASNCSYHLEMETTTDFQFVTKVYLMDQAFYKIILKSTVQVVLHLFNSFCLWWCNKQNCWCQYYFSLVDNFLQISWYGWYLKVWLEIDSKMVFLMPGCTTSNVTYENMGNCANVSRFRIKTE